MIQLSHVTKVYRASGREVRAVDDVSLTVAAGEFAVLQGRSGSGKSTLLSLIGGLTTATSGDVVVDGHDLNRLSRRQRAALRGRTIGFVFQMFHLLPYLSVERNVLLAAADGIRAATRERAVSLLAELDMGHRRFHRPGELSVGERQRVALARALLNQPRLLLADEPTGNLDRVSAEIVCNHLRAFQSRGGTVVLATHDPLTAACGQRSICLEQGQTIGAAS